MNIFRADIHCHSDCSDGSDSPLHLIDLALAANLQGLAITDHDTIEAYTPELFKKAKTHQLQLLTGIELSTEFYRESVHVLGYGFDVHSSSLRVFLQEMQKRRTSRNRMMLDLLARKNMPISEEELFQFAARKEGKKTIGRPHIAALMVQKGYVATWQEAFQGYLKEGAPCYVPGIKFTPLQAIEEIRKAHGKAVLAHPHLMKRKSKLREILALPFDGIECYYARLPKAQELPWLQLAERKGWIATGGSDYHGAFKPNLSLGCSWVNETTFAKLLPR